MQEIQVLGNQNLSTLRDAICCYSDFSPRADNPPELDLYKHTHLIIDRINSRTCKMSSSYFFIEDVFYNDSRSPKAVDYSE